MWYSLLYFQIIISLRLLHQLQKRRTGCAAGLATALGFLLFGGAVSRPFSAIASHRQVMPLQHSLYVYYTMPAPPLSPLPAYFCAV